MIAELARLNAEYERRHGFRFVVFVNRRPKAEILEVLQSRIDHPTDEELETALRELVAIADRPLAARVSTPPLALDPYVTDWLNLLIRWLHVIAAIAWIGASFYFVLLDQSLRAAEGRGRPRATASAASCGRCTAAASTT